jgi:hypothetical protein
MRWKCAVVVACLVAARGAFSQEVVAKARTDSVVYNIGDWINIHVDLTHPPGVILHPTFTDTLDGFLVISRKPVWDKDERHSATRVIVSKYDSGVAVLPPLSFSFILGTDSTLQTITTNPITLTIRTVEVDTSKDFHDLKPPVPVSLSFLEVLLYAAIIDGSLLVLYLLYYYWKKRRSQVRSAEPVYVPPPRPAHIVALEQLALLKEKKLWQQGLIKQYYSEVTEIVRRYFENRYGFAALEQTTDEIMLDLRKHVHASDIWEETERVLRLADLVKFAKYQPGMNEHENAVTVAYDIVEKTKLVELKKAEPEAVHAEPVGS